MTTFERLEARSRLLDFARLHYAAEIEAETARYIANRTPDSFFADFDNLDLIDREAATINISRRHSPEEWRLLDEAERAEHKEANDDDM